MRKIYRFYANPGVRGRCHQVVSIEAETIIEASKMIKQDYPQARFFKIMQKPSTK